MRGPAILRQAFRSWLPHMGDWASTVGVLFWSLSYERGWPMVRIEAAQERPENIAALATLLAAEVAPAA